MNTFNNNPPLDDLNSSGESSNYKDSQPLTNYDNPKPFGFFWGYVCIFLSVLMIFYLAYDLIRSPYHWLYRIAYAILILLLATECLALILRKKWALYLIFPAFVIELLQVGLIFQGMFNFIYIMLALGGREDAKGLAFESLMIQISLLSVPLIIALITMLLWMNYLNKRLEGKLSKILMIAIIIGSVLFYIGVISYYQINFYNRPVGPSDQTKTQEESLSTINETVPTWLDYKNNKYSYQVKYPEFMRFLNGTDQMNDKIIILGIDYSIKDVSKLIKLRDGGYEWSIIVYDSDKNKIYKLNDILSMPILSGSGCRSIKNQEEILVNGNNALKISGEDLCDENNVKKFTATVIEKKPYYYFFQCISKKDDNYLKCNEIFDQFVSSFKSTDNKQVSSPTTIITGPNNGGASDNEEVSDRQKTKKYCESITYPQFNNVASKYEVDIKGDAVLCDNTTGECKCGITLEWKNTASLPDDCDNTIKLILADIKKIQTISTNYVFLMRFCK